MKVWGKKRFMNVLLLKPFKPIIPEILLKSCFCCQFTNLHHLSISFFSHYAQQIVCLHVWACLCVYVCVCMYVYICICVSVWLCLFAYKYFLILGLFQRSSVSLLCVFIHIFLIMNTLFLVLCPPTCCPVDSLKIVYVGIGYLNFTKSCA